MGGGCNCVSWRKKVHTGAHVGKGGTGVSARGCTDGNGLVYTGRGTVTGVAAIIPCRNCIGDPSRDGIFDGSVQCGICPAQAQADNRRRTLVGCHPLNGGNAA